VETFTTHNNPTIPDTPGVIITATQVAVLSSFGNVTGPVSAINNSIARYNGTTGKVITDGANSTIDDNGNAVFAGTLSANGGTMNGNLNVVGQILSGGVDISTLFGTGSGDASDNEAVNTLVQNTSANWNSSYTTVNATSANWSNVYSTVTANSASWIGGNSAFTTLNSNSASWITESALTNVRINSVGGTFNNPVANDLIYIPCVYSGSIAAYTIQLIGSGTCTIKTWKKASGTTNPTISDLISTSGVSLAAGNVIRSTDVSDFTNTTIDANDLLAFQITQVTGSPTQVIFVIQVNKT
jgi:hypothetical protein